MTSEQAVERQAAHENLMRELMDALEEVLRISDRKHDAWDKAKAALARAKEQQS